jgi:FkbM family methyltransferase
LFFGKRIQLLLPSATDLFLTGGKTHSSEIRLARFFIRHVKPDYSVLDIGAHYGYFSLLASELVSGGGEIISCEPSPQSFRVLQQNCSAVSHITVLQKAVSDADGELQFYEFPNLYSEYNSSDVRQFETEEWYHQFQPVVHRVQSVTIDSIVLLKHFKPQLIKIDVEGAELSVLTGGKEYFQSHSPFVVMEYLAAERSNEPHRRAVDLMKEMGYQTTSLMMMAYCNP